MDFQQKQSYDINDLLRIVKILRGENGCPWDREQTHQSIRTNMIEETYEAVEAIDKQDSELLLEELGDVLLQVVFHAEIETSEGGFNFDDICNGICHKLIIRHPHVFGDVDAKSTQQVLTNWEKIKQKTKGQKTYAEALRSVPEVLPALMRSEKLQSRAAKAGFDYPDSSYAMNDLCSEVDELKEAISSGVGESIDEELGDLLFSCVNVARFYNIDSEFSLTKSCEKFIKRFEEVEKLSNQNNIDMKTASIDQLNKLWEQAKTK